MDISDLKSIEIERCSFPIGPFDVKTITVDLVTGLCRKTDGDDYYAHVLTVTVDREGIGRIFDYIASSGILKEGLEPEHILDGTWYYATLDTSDGPREVTWNCGNHDVDFSMGDLWRVILSSDAITHDHIETSW